MADSPIPSRRDFAQEISRNRTNSIVLLVGFPLLIVALGFAFDIFTGVTPWGVIAALVVSVVLIISAWFDGARTILELSHAREATPELDSQLINVVDEMRIAAGQPMPRVYVIETSAANAFATGRDPDHSAIAVTRGLLETLNREELQGVIGHEMSHIRNFDIRYMLLVAALLGSVLLLSDGLRFGARVGRGSIGRSRDRGGAGILGLIALVFAILSPFIAMLLQAAISRQREFLADSSSVELTRNPLALASALEKIEQLADDRPLESANRATQHLYIVNPLRAFGENASALMSTHPPTAERVRVLRAMS